MAQATPVKGRGSELTPELCLSRRLCGASRCVGGATWALRPPTPPQPGSWYITCWSEIRCAGEEFGRMRLSRSGDSVWRLWLWQEVLRLVLGPRSFLPTPHAQCFGGPSLGLVAERSAEAVRALAAADSPSAAYSPRVREAWSGFHWRLIAAFQAPCVVRVGLTFAASVVTDYEKVKTIGGKKVCDRFEIAFL